MHPAVVADASVWVSQVSSREIHHNASRLWLERYIKEGGSLVAPRLLLIEVASAIARQTGRLKFAKTITTTLRQYNNLTLISLDDAFIEKVADIATDLRLRAGDAIYVALAHRQGLPIVSWDNEQLQRSSPFIETYTPTNYPF